MPRLLPIPLLILLSYGTVAPRPAAAAEIKEPETGVAFPVNRRWGKYRMIAVGVAVKEKFAFDVYAACLYLDRQRGKRALQRFLGTPQGQALAPGGKLDKAKLMASRQFYRWLIGANLPLTIDSTFVRDAPLERLKARFSARLAPFIKDRAVLRRFIALPHTAMKKYRHMTLNIMPGGRVIVQYMGKTHPAIVSRPLARALLSAYFSPRSEIKQGLVSRIDRLLQ